MRHSRSVLTGLTALLLAAGGLAATTVPADAAEAEADVKINEIESSGGTPGDWVELKNTGLAPVDVSGWTVKDNDDTHTYVLPTPTMITAGAYLTLDVDAAGAPGGGFGLGGTDSVRLFPTGAASPTDTYSWTGAATTTYGRCPDGTGAFATTTSVTRNAANDCAVAPPVTPASPWPGDEGVRTVDRASLVSGNLSGLVYEGTGTTAPGTLWAVRNGAGTLYQLNRTGSTWDSAPGDWSAGKDLNYASGTGDPDAEGVTITDAGSAGGIFVSTERDNDLGVSRPAVLRFDPSTAGTSLSATRDWNLTADLPVLAPNAGLEGIAWVPDSYLTASGFVDQKTGAAYAPASYPGHGNGLFFVGVEGNGSVYAYALDQTSDSYVRVASFASGFTGVMELTWESETQKLWVVCDDTCQGRSTRFGVDTTAGSATLGRFVAGPLHERPAGMPNLNNEGFAVTPRSECVGGLKPVFWADDSDTAVTAGQPGYSLREGTLSCTPVPTTAMTPTTTPTAPDRTAPRVKVAGVKDGGVYRSKRPKVRCQATDVSGVARCTLKKRSVAIGGGRVLSTVKAVAVDTVGNRATTTKTYVARR